MSKILDLVTSLEDNPSMQERSLLDEFISSHTHTYHFPQDFQPLLGSLFSSRLTIKEFTFTQDFYPYVLKILQTIRILSRDKNLLGDSLISAPSTLAVLLKTYAHQHFLDFNAKHLSELLVEIATILRRLCDCEVLGPELLKDDIPEVLCLMLGSTHAIVARATLEALISLSAMPGVHQVLEKTCIVELLLRIISEYDGEFIQLASKLLNSICENEEMSRQVRMQRGNLIMLK